MIPVASSVGHSGTYYDPESPTLPGRRPAGLLSVIVFPLVAVTLLRSTEDEALPVAAPAR